MAQLGWQEQPFSGHAESTGHLASGKEIDLAFGGDLVFHHSLDGKLNFAGFLNVGFPKNKLSAFVHLRHRNHSFLIVHLWHRAVPEEDT